MIKEAIILAGGLGTRLRDAVPDLPKCMAPVNGKPFIAYIIDYCFSQNTEDFIFSLGYKHEVVTEYLAEYFRSRKQSYTWKIVVEEEPLGTGGGIKLAAGHAMTENVFVLNGDTLFSCDLSKLEALHETRIADCTLALKPMAESDRYGVVETASDGRVTSFREKDRYINKNINGGIYALNVARFLKEDLPAKFSFEKDYLEALCGKRKIYGLADDGYFIDIGIPSDYARANNELKDF